MEAKQMTMLERSKAIVCFGKLVEQVELAHKNQSCLQEEFNCKNCSNFKYCCSLADTLLSTVIDGI